MSTNWPKKLVVKDSALLIWAIRGISDPFVECSPKFCSRTLEFMFCLYFKVEQNKTSVMLHSNSTGQNSELPIRYQIAITRREILPEYQEQVHSQEFEFKRMEVRRGEKCFDDYISFDICNRYVEEYERGHNKLNILCSVDILEEVADVNTEDMMNLSDNFGSLLTSGTLSDMILSAGGKDFPVHKNILASRSPVFGAMFENKDSKEVQDSRILIEDMSSDVAEVMLKHIYTGRNPTNMSEYAFDLYVAADKYQLTNLKSACEKALINLLDINSVSSVLLIADGCNSVKLKSKCIHYITNNSVEVMKTEGWKQIEVKHDLLVELFGRLSQESQPYFSNKRLKVE